MRFLMIILAFNFIIIIHELGHFIVAKMSNIKVEEFSLFIGPKLFSVKRGETMYSLRLFPILAYVKMEGEDEASDSDRAFYKKPVWTRAAVIAAGPLANILATFVIITVFFAMSGFASTTIDYVRENSPAYNAGLREGDEVVSYDNKRVFQPMDVYQFLFISKGEPTEIEVKRNGQEIDMHIEPKVKQYYLGFATTNNVEESNIVSSVQPGTPAEEAGLQAGDEIIKLNDTEVQTLDEISSFLQINKEKPIDIAVNRGGNTQVLRATPFKAEQPEFDVGMSFKFKKGNFGELIKQAAVFTYSNTRMVVYTLGWLVTGKVHLNQMVGPVGIVSSMNDVVQGSESTMDAILNLMYITAFISVAVGATNLIPFPALDGSKLVLLIVEAVRRKPIPIEKEAAIMTVGFFLLIGLAIFITSNDIYKLVERLTG